MDTKILQTFVEVMRHRSFAAVAKEHNIDPSSVSRAISNLEKELEVRLFQRTTRHLSPTEAGITYFNRIEPLLEEIQRAKELVTQTQQPKGTLRVTASVSFGIKCIIPFLAEFESVYPNLSIELLLTDYRLDLLTERIDLAIRLGQLQDSTLIAQRLMLTTYSVCASPKYLEQHESIAQPKDITQHNCLCFPIVEYKTRWIFRDPQKNISKINVHGRTIISNAIGLQQCAIAGMGLALLPHWLVDSEIEKGNLVKVLPDYDVTATDFNTSVWFVYPSRNYVPLKVKIFMDFFKGKLIQADGRLVILS